ncbi:hypothetical protein GGR53DRAFT_515786 [Hypoxylon sp. FL1150]|nr:hypothetical protein GGR53DRAFT_515786 [Hypoxylon sp. FL1150]
MTLRICRWLLVQPVAIYALSVYAKMRRKRKPWILSGCPQLPVTKHRHVSSLCCILSNELTDASPYPRLCSPVIVWIRPRSGI